MNEENGSDTSAQGDDPAQTLRADDALEETRSLVRLGNSAVVQVILGTTPWAGGAGVALSQLAQRRQEVRLREFLNSLVRRVNDMEREGEEVDTDFIRSDEFVAFMAGVAEEAARAASQERLEYLRAFLASCSIRRRPDATWIELFMRYLPRLSGTHLALLEAVYEKQKGYPASDRLGDKRLQGLPISGADIQEDRFGDLLVGVGLVDLANLGLLVDWKLSSGQGAAYDAFSLSRNGLLFMRFVRSDWVGGPTTPPVD